ncbi:30S ribosomal protein S2 [Candidatus Dojkabacteria bacterium]|nr:30S ribosomal protein S2 [Candidatus Dojkabacteria bacterium]
MQEPTKTVEFTLPSLDELLAAGVHFGHKTSAWNPKMKPFIYAQRNGVHIIDLISTLTQLKKALTAIKSASDTGNILVVGTKGQAASLVQVMAEESGAFYINKRWPGGLFTNFKAIKKSVDKLVSMEETLASGGEGLVKKEQLLMKRDVERLNKIYSGIKFMDKLPTLMVVIDSKLEKNAVKEAKNVGMPIVSLIDTNSDPKLVTFPVPANDDSIKSISLFIKMFGLAIKEGIRAKSLLTLRKEEENKLLKMAEAYAADVEKKRLMEEQERERIKALKEGKSIDEASTRTVRVVSKAK